MTTAFSAIESRSHAYLGVDLPKNPDKSDLLILFKDFLVESNRNGGRVLIVIDEANQARFEYRIYMNNVLNYGGYRFFQSSFDQDEQGTILSVNHDYWGTLITYIGYALLFGSLIVSFFTRTRIHTITTRINEIHEERKKLGTSAAAIILLLA